MAKEVLDGQKFGKLLVISFNGVVKENRTWNCICECGNNTIVSSNKLKSGRTRSCGCGVTESRFSHGMSKSREFKTWTTIKGRCYNKTNKSYKDYGARGIIVCERWLKSFENFYEDMGPKPSRNHSIDRINNNGNYEPENCKWATKEEQNNNTRVNIYLTYNNRTLTLSQWAKELDLKYSALQSRLARGWSVEKTLNTPIRTIKKGNKNDE